MTTLFEVTPIRPKSVADAYWYLAAERQRIFFKRYRGEGAPWTDDRLLQEYKFTNAYRAADRISQFLIRKVIYATPQSARAVFFRTMLFKFFNKIETWQLLETAVGAIDPITYDFRLYDSILTKALLSGSRIYSAAYIMPSPKCGGTFKHQNHLMLLGRMMRDGVPERIADARSLQDVYEVLRAYPGIGPFLAFQYAIDLNYSEIINFDEDTFVVAGPGALEGIRKCMPGYRGSPEDVIRQFTSEQERHFERLGFEFENLWGRRLKLIDCQNLFCEIGKYARVAYPDAGGVRRRIKQRYRVTMQPLEYAFPMKWGLPKNVSVCDHRSIECRNVVDRS